MSSNIRSLAARFEQAPQQPSYTHPSIATGVYVQTLRQSYEVRTQRQTPPIPTVLDRLFRDSFLPRNIASFLDRISLLQLKKSSSYCNRTISQMDRDTRPLHHLFSEITPKGRPYPQDIVRLIGSYLSELDRFCLHAVQAQVPTTAAESALCVVLTSAENPAQALDEAILLLKTISIDMLKLNGLVSEEGKPLFDQNEIPEGYDTAAMRARVIWLQNICRPNFQAGNTDSRNRLAIYKKTSLLTGKLVCFFCNHYQSGHEEIIRCLLKVWLLRPSDASAVSRALNALWNKGYAIGLLQDHKNDSLFNFIKQTTANNAHALRWTKIFLNILDPEATILDATSTNSLKKQLLDLLANNWHYPELFQYLTQRYKVSVMQHKTHVTLFSSVQETHQGKVMEYFCFPVPNHMMMWSGRSGTLSLPTPLNLQEMMNINSRTTGLDFINSPFLLQHFIRLNDHHLTPSKLRNEADALSIQRQANFMFSNLASNFIATLRGEAERMEKERSQ